MFLTLGRSIKLKPPDFLAAMKRSKKVLTPMSSPNYEYEDNERNMQIKTYIIHIEKSIFNRPYNDTHA